MTVRYFLTKLGVEGFRGIKNEGDPLTLHFKPDAVNSIYAQNGVGKTSVFEAISYAIFDKLPKLDRLQRNERPEDYYVNRFHTGGVGSILLEFTPDDNKSKPVEILVERTVAGKRTVTSPTKHPDPTAFLNAFAEDFTTVDYPKFAQFIDDTPLARGRTFSSLIGLTRFARVRQLFDKARDTRALNTDLQMPTLSVELDTAERTIREKGAAALTEYEAVTGRTIPDLTLEAEAIQAVTQALSSVQTLTASFTGKDILSVGIEAARAVIVTAEGGPHRTEYQQVVRAVDSLSKCALTPAAEADIEGLLELARRRDAAVAAVGSKEQQDLFGAVKKVVVGTSWPNPNECPVCETRIGEPVASRVDRLLERYREADQLGQELERGVLNSPWLEWLSKIENCSALTIRDDKRYRDTIRRLSGNGGLTEGFLREASDSGRLLEEERTNALTAANARERELQAALPPSLVALTQQLEAGYRFREAIFGHRKAVRQASASRIHKEWRNRWQKFINAAADIVSDAETRLAKNRITTIEAGYQGLFRTLVRGGVDMKPKLVRAEDSENVDLQLDNFYGEAGVSARAVLSESYRNAIAGSIFFSAAVEQKGPARFMILDDITSSFDGGHQFALMEALRTQLQARATATGLQFIVLSHDTLLEKYFE